jgi:UDP-N-acetylglucosamine transferase subunit ALG13
VIFLTVGTQLPFDRLVEMVDLIVPDLGVRVFAQTGAGKYRPKNMEWNCSLSAIDFDRRAAGSTLIISHAGIGSVLTAKRYRKPIVLVPRLASRGEHRNDHQMATVSLLKGKPGVYVANDHESLRAALRQAHALIFPSKEESSERGKLISYLREALEPRHTTM